MLRIFANNYRAFHAGIIAVKYGVRCNFNEIRVIKTHNDPLHVSLHDFVEDNSCCRQRVAIKNTNPSRRANRVEEITICEKSFDSSDLFFSYGSFYSASEFTCNATRRVVSANIELCNYWHSKHRGRYRDARYRPTNVDTYTSQCVKIIISLRLHGKRETSRGGRVEMRRRYVAD